MKQYYASIGAREEPEFVGYLIEENEGEYIWIRWHKIREGRVRQYRGSAYIRENMLVLNPIPVVDSEKWDIERVRTYLHNLPIWDKTECYVVGFNYQAVSVVVAATGKIIDQSTADRILTKLHIGKTTSGKESKEAILHRKAHLDGYID